MELTSSQIWILNKGFNAITISRQYGYDFLFYDCNLEKKRRYNKYCVINTDGECEVPIFALPYFYAYKNYDKIYVPISLIHREIRATTANKIISECLSADIYNGLEKLISTKKSYYALKGLLMDADFTPLLLLTRTYKDKILTKLNVYIHPKIFLDTKDIVHKAIIKQVIYYYSSNSIRLAPLTNSEMNTVEFKPEIIIKDPSCFLSSSEKLKSAVNLNEDISNFLFKNVDSIIDSM